MLQPQLRGPPRLAIADPFAAAINCSRGASHRRRRRSKPKPIAFPPPPLRRLASSSLRRILPRHSVLLLGGGGGGWFRLGRGRKTPAEELAVLALSLVLGGDRIAAVAEAWNASGLGQALGIWAAVWRRGRRRSGLRRLAAFLLGVAFCALVCRLRGAAFLDELRKTGGGRKLVRILLH